MNVHSFEKKHPVHDMITINISDLPASRKSAGLAGHTLEHFFCPFCSKTFSSLVSPLWYDPRSYLLKTLINTV
jgi:hypothetical protein